MDGKNASKNAKRNTESARVLALIPAHNEASHIASVVAGALAYLPVLVVDDGSTDDTAARAGASGAAVLHQTPNQGKGAALRAGFRQAIHEGYDAVLTLDERGPPCCVRRAKALPKRGEAPLTVV